MTYYNLTIKHRKSRDLLWRVLNLFAILQLAIVILWEQAKNLTVFAFNPDFLLPIGTAASIISSMIFFMIEYSKQKKKRAGRKQRRMERRKAEFERLYLKNFENKKSFEVVT